MNAERAAKHLGFSHPRVNVLGVNVSALDMEAAVDRAHRWIAVGSPAYVCMTGVHGVMEAQSDPYLQSVLNDALINAPDGMPMSWIGWLHGHRQMNRVYGPDFMARLCHLSLQQGYRHFLYGGRPGVAQELKLALEQRFPGIQIVGTFTPPFRHLTQQEECDLVQIVKDAKPDILWVGLSTPKQERFMAEYLDRLGVALLVGVGAAFDLHTGRIHDAPQWIKRSGLQWLHRMLQDPRRLTKRYLVNNPAFLWNITLQLLNSALLRHADSTVHANPRQTPDNLSTDA